MGVGVHLWLVFLALAVGLQLQGCAAYNLASDCHALQALFNATDGSSWHENSGWTAAPGVTTCCEWYGVACEEIRGESRVVSLLVGANRLSGSLPSELGNLVELQRLALGDTEILPERNRIRGTLPAEWAALSSLRFVDLSNNDITGSLPREWSAMESLEVLYLSNCSLEGSLPREYAAWRNMELFVAPWNKLSGALPCDWSAWTGVASITLQSNNLTGYLPSEWGAMSNMSVFSCYDNMFEGSLPSQWSTWSGLRRFYMQYNDLSGTLAPELSSWIDVEQVFLQFNKLQGTLPSEYAAWSEITALFVTGNRLTGSLPTAWSAWSRMEQFLVSRNALHGDLPSEYAAWTNATDLVLGDNKFTGSLPPEWASMRSLNSLYVHSNLLSGPLPSAWSSWSEMKWAFFYDNNFTGSLPTEWGDWHSPKATLFSDNPFVGTLPSEYGAWEDIDLFSLCSSRIEGSLPSEWSSWRNVSTITICQNPKLTGGLPASWGELGSLRQLFLNANALSGTIPPEWSDMAALTTLSLEDNDLEGSLDVCIPALESVAVARNNIDAIASCMAGTRVISLDMQKNNFSDLPVEIISSSAFTVLDFQHCDIQLDIRDLPMTAKSAAVLRLANNAGVYGAVESLLSSHEDAAYIELDFSNTSIGGTLDLLDPLSYDEAFVSIFPLTNVQRFNVSSTNVGGTLPWGWFNWVGGNGKELMLVVEDAPHVQAVSTGELPRTCEEIVSDRAVTLPFDCDGVAISYGDATFLCKPLQFPDGVIVLGLSAAYFQYRTCQCAPGYSGTPPNCNLSSDSAEVLGLAIPFAILTAIVVTLGVRQLLRWRALASDLRRAHGLLEMYVKDSGSGTSHVAPLLGTRAFSEDWVVPYGDLRVVKTIASGAQGQVSMALWNRTVVAVKEFFVRSEDERESLLGEAAMHIQLRHPNIVQLLGVCLEPACVVIEWMERGSLFDVIRNDPTSLPGIRQVALDIARGMLYLHSKGIIHRDLKSLNVMLDSRYTAKVGDFGNARRNSAESTMTVGLGTMHWMAPEVFASEHYSEKCDVYSFGMLLWELMTGEVPFSEYSFSYQVMEAVRSGSRPDLQRIPDVEERRSLVELMVQCWDADPYSRPSFDAIVQKLESC